VIDPTLRPAWVVSRIKGSRISPATTEVAPGWIKQFLGLLWSGHVSRFVYWGSAVSTEAVVLGQFMTTVPAIPISQDSASLGAAMMPCVGALRIWH
jgi:hypothetical protein